MFGILGGLIAVVFGGLLGAGIGRYWPLSGVVGLATAVVVAIVTPVVGWFAFAGFIGVLPPGDFSTWGVSSGVCAYAAFQTLRAAPQSPPETKRKQHNFEVIKGGKPPTLH